jgi:haloacetate dehalogenase
LFERPQAGAKSALGGSIASGPQREREETAMAATTQGFEARHVLLDGIELFVRRGGRRGAPALLLLHGYPQTGAIWRRVAERLAGDFELLIPDLRGYGASSKPPGLPDHANYSKRAMADDVARLMTAFGHERFFVCGHDRGGRVAHRLALDHAERVERLVGARHRADAGDVRAHDHGLRTRLLPLVPPDPAGAAAGDAPRRRPAVPPALQAERLGLALARLHRARGNGRVRGGLRAPETIHATCEDYRASAGIDLEHDRASIAAEHRDRLPLLALWGERGVVHRLFEPLALWQAVCDRPVEGRPVPSGHYIPEELPELTAQELARFFAD